MKIVLIIISIIFLAGIIAFFVLGQMSQSGKANGIIEGKLSKCPDKPNCICTEFEADLTHYIEPIAYSPRTPSEVLTRLKNSIAEMGGGPSPVPDGGPWMRYETHQGLGVPIRRNDHACKALGYLLAGPYSFLASERATRSVLATSYLGPSRSHAR